MASTDVFVRPPLDGSVNIPETLDFHWKHNAKHPIFVFNRDGSSELTEVSFLEFGRACHRVAHALRPQRAGEREVVAFIALADSLLYQSITVGLMIAGLVPFPISPRNTPAAVVHLLKKTSCHRLITTQTTLRGLVDGIRSELATSDPNFALSVEEIPALDAIFPKLGAETSEDPFETYPAPPSKTSLADIGMYLHSSGSTGFPKAIPQSHLTLVHWAAFPSQIQYSTHTPRVRIAGMPLPAFHTLGIYIQLIYSLYGGMSIGLYPPTATSPSSLPVMPTPDNVLEHMQRTKSNGLITIPALLEIWAQSDEAVDLLKTLEFVGYSGGSIAPKLGDFMTAAGVRLFPGYGGTEFGSPTYPFPRKGDELEWAYMEFDSRTNVRWVPQGDGTYECQFLTTETHSLPIENLPDVRGYATSDLWEPHPTKDYLWKIVGRIDDVIIHSSGEKTVPGPMEDIVLSSPYVMGVVMFGREHDQPGILVEPKPAFAIDIEDQKQLVGFRNKLWSIVEEANKVAPTFSRIFKEMILVTSATKPLARTGKGTVMKKMSLKAYDEEIEALYDTVESSAKVEDVVPPVSWTNAGVQAWLLEQAGDIHKGQVFSPFADVFEQGFDSLSATILRRRIVGALRSSKDAKPLKAADLITQNTLYNYPTIEALTAFLAGVVADPEGYTDGKSGKTSVEDMIKKYSAGLGGPLPAVATSVHAPGAGVVLLTGSTGNLGSQVLALLLEDRAVARVYTLNRGSSGSLSILERHRQRFEDKALDSSLLTSKKLVFIEADLTLPNFGLSEASFHELRNSTNVIIHTAWKLDFNQSLSSFEPNVRGSRNLIDLARSGPHASSLRFLFTSSVSSAYSWDQSKGPFPEEVVHDAGVAIGSGYGESKYVTERVLEKSGIQATSFRIGQISGGLPNGAWATSDWVPSLVKSSLALGALPNAAGIVSWLPMDAVARSLIDIAFAKEQPPIALNLVHPKPVEWTSVISSIGEALARERNLASPVPVVPFQDWFSLLEKRARTATDKDMKEVPAIKLLEFFRTISSADDTITRSGQKDAESGGLTRFATEKAQTRSATMKDLAPLGNVDAQRWVKYWNESGFFD